jgi:hypothetical protein
VGRTAGGTHLRNCLLAERVRLVLTRGHDELARVADVAAVVGWIEQRPGCWIEQQPGCGGLLRCDTFGH